MGHDTNGLTASMNRRAAADVWDSILPARESIRRWHGKMQIPYKKIKTIKYPCVDRKTKVLYCLYAYIGIFCAALAFHAISNRHYEAVPFLLSLPILTIAFINFIITFQDMSCVRKIKLFLLQNAKADYAEIWALIEHRRGALISPRVLRAPRDLFLAGKLLESYAIDQNDARRLTTANDMIALACQYDNALAKFREEDGLPSVIDPATVTQTKAKKVLLSLFYKLFWILFIIVTMLFLMLNVIKVISHN